MDFGKRCELPCGVWGGVPAEIELALVYFSFNLCRLVAASHRRAG